MASAVITVQAQIGGISINANNTLTGNSQESCEATLAAAHTGSLGTRTDANTGIVTMSAGHGITDGKVVVSWTSGGVRKSRVNMDATVVDNAVTIDGGDGDDLPAQGEDVEVAMQTDLAAAFDGDDLLAIAANSSRDATAKLYDSGGAVLATVEMFAGSAWYWMSGMGTSSPITGNAVAKVSVGSRSTVGTSTFKMGLLQNI